MKKGWINLLGSKQLSVDGLDSFGSQGGEDDLAGWDVSESQEEDRR